MATDQPTVTYKDIPGHPGYRVGDDGSVWSAWYSTRLPGRRAGFRHAIGDTWRRLSTIRKPWGHLRVTLAGSHPPRIYPVHRLVLLTFVGPCPEGMECCHNDGNPANNRPGNLRWDTRKANAEDAVRHGRVHPTIGTKHHNARLDPDKVRAMRAEYAAGGATLRSLARKYGVGNRAVYCVVARLTWKHVA